MAFVVLYKLEKKWEKWGASTRYKNAMNFRLFAGRQGISEDKDDGVTTQEHFADKSVLVDGLGLLLACKDTNEWWPMLAHYKYSY